jgi:hypothetical protein
MQAGATNLDTSRRRALRRSPFRSLAARDLLGLVLGRADLLAHDAFCVALVCRAFRDQVFEYCPPPPNGGPRLTTVARSVGLSVARLAWARALASPPPWLRSWDVGTSKVLARVGLGGASQIELRGHLSRYLRPQTLGPLGQGPFSQTVAEVKRV